MSKPSVSGFSILRNGTLMNYPFLESLRSALPLCDEFILNLGDCTDDTEAHLAQLSLEFPGKLKLIRTHWEKKNQTGGSQLKIQSDRALAECQGDWCLYLQADEVLHEQDYPKLREAMAAADPLPQIDGIVFDYLHFYGNYDYVISGRSWYRKEVRLFKNRRGIQTYRDAQGFRKAGKKIKALYAGTKIYHYGHVQSVETNLSRREQMATWWGEAANLNDPKLRYFNHTGLKKFVATHPSTMTQRLKQNPICVDPSKRPRVFTLKEWRDRITLLWESIVPYRFGEFKNYEI